MLRYAITDRSLFPGTETDRRSAVVAQATRLAREGIDYLQVREKDLAPRELLELTLAVRDAVEASGSPIRVVLNASPELAAAAGVGLHLPFPIWSERKQSVGETRATSIACHSPEEVEAAAAFAEVLLFAPVFEKVARGQHVRPGSGLAALAEACARSAGVPVLALGGVTYRNAPACLAAGAAGIAGIRLFLA